MTDDMFMDYEMLNYDDFEEKYSYDWELAYEEYFEGLEERVIEK